MASHVLSRREEQVSASCESSTVPLSFDALEEDVILEHYEFGGKIARRVGADLSGDHDEESMQRLEVDEHERAMQMAARPRDWKAKLAELDFDARVKETLECLQRKNNQKEILSDLLNFCFQERAEEELEAFLTAHKQFADGYHTANKYLFFMQRTGALAEREYDSEGVLMDEERRADLLEQGISEDEIDELVVEWCYITTDVGKEALTQFNPCKRTQEMLATQASSRMASFRRLLEFCKQPRSLEEITNYMADDPGLEIDLQTGVAHMQPSAYIGKLDQSGALTWEGGWKTTEGGMEVLNSLAVD